MTQTIFSFAIMEQAPPGTPAPADARRRPPLPAPHPRRLEPAETALGVQVITEAAAGDRAAEQGEPKSHPNPPSGAGEPEQSAQSTTDGKGRAPLPSGSLCQTPEHTAQTVNGSLAHHATLMGRCLKSAVCGRQDLTLA